MSMLIAYNVLYAYVVRNPLMTQPLRFAIYPGGELGSDSGLTAGAADNTRSVLSAIAQLKPPTAPLILRVYERFQDENPKYHPTSPFHSTPLLDAGYPLDLVLQFNSLSGNVPGFCDFVRRKANEFGPRLYSVQITEEANFTHGPDCIDGPYPNVLRALVEGVIAAREVLDGVPIGFSVTPTFGPNAAFWTNLAALATPAFHDALGYAGLDFFPDVFSPVAGDLRETVAGLLKTMRSEWLPAAGIGASTPIHICEWGWPTARTRPESRQAEVTETVIRTVHDARGEHNIHRFTLFALRDAVTANQDDFFCGFGFLRDDYSPKPAL